jgi:hypothetical protein
MAVMKEPTTSWVNSASLEKMWSRDMEERPIDSVTPVFPARGFTYALPTRTDTRAGTSIWIVGPLLTELQ